MVKADMTVEDAPRAVMTCVRIAALIVLGVAMPAVAHADSDGYTRGPQGIPEPAALDLPQFQVHGMVCGEGWVDIGSFTAIYRITLDENLRPVQFAVRGCLRDKPISQPFIL